MQTCDIMTPEPRPLSAYFTELAAQATERARAHKFEAEVAPTPGRWHVLVTQPNRETTAAAHLIGRGFGTYLPEITKVAIVRGRKRTCRQALFPGYLFVFVWGIEAQWRRIAACTGITRLLLKDDKPAVVADEIIGEIQATEFNCLMETGALHLQDDHRRPRKRMKRWQRQLRETEDKSIPEGKFRVSTKGYFADVEKQEPEARNSILRRALGLGG
jgi:transcription antitermination factor NusG